MQHNQDRPSMIDSATLFVATRDGASDVVTVDIKLVVAVDAPPVNVVASMEADLFFLNATIATSVATMMLTMLSRMVCRAMFSWA